MNRYAFSQRLCYEISKRKLTIKEVAERTEINYKTFYNYLQGTIPSDDKLQRIADFLGVEAFDLLAECYGTENE